MSVEFEDRDAVDGLDVAQRHAAIATDLRARNPAPELLATGAMSRTSTPLTPSAAGPPRAHLIDDVESGSRTAVIADRSVSEPPG